MVFIILSFFLLPVFAHLADKIGRKPLLYFATIGYLLFAIPCFKLLAVIDAWWVLLPLVLFYSAEQAVSPVVLVEMFGGKGRYTGLSLGYNVCMATVGGFSPAFNTWGIHYWGNTMIVAYYVIFCALVSLYTVIKYLPNEYGSAHSLTHVF